MSTLVFRGDYPEARIVVQQQVAAHRQQIAEADARAKRDLAEQESNARLALEQQETSQRLEIAQAHAISRFKVRLALFGIGGILIGASAMAAVLTFAGA